MANSNDNIVYGIEKRYGVQAIESEARNLWYLQDEERKYLGFMTIIKRKPIWLILKKEQIKTILKELKDIYDMVFN